MHAEVITAVKKGIPRVGGRCKCEKEECEVCTFNYVARREMFDFGTCRVLRCMRVYTGFFKVLFFEMSVNLDSSLTFLNLPIDS